MTTVGLLDTSTHTAIELESCLFAPSALPTDQKVRVRIPSGAPFSSARQPLRFAGAKPPRMGDRSAGKRGFTSHRADPASQWAASSAPFDDRCGSGCGGAGDNGVPGGVDGDGMGSPSAEITVCAPVLVSMAITVLSSGWPRRRFRHRRPPPDRSAFFQPGLW